MPTPQAKVGVIASVWDAVGADCIVNPVNTEGVMGAGLAKGIADRWPAILEPYRAHCRSGTFKPGDVWLWTVPSEGEGGAAPASSPPRAEGLDGPVRFVLCLASKGAWRHPSRLEWVASGLRQMSDVLRATPEIRHIAMPAVGCGRGGLDWQEVAPLVRQLVRQFPDRIWSVAPPQDIEPPRATGTPTGTGRRRPV